jgi:hypothetical protein
MAKVLLIAEHDGASLNPNTAKCVACAAEISGAEIDVAVFAETAGGIAAEAASLEQATGVRSPPYSPPGSSPWPIVTIISSVRPRPSART